MAEDTFDPVPEITVKHFQEAMKDARRTVSDESLRAYSKFATDMQQARSQLNAGTGVSMANFQFPTGVPAAGPAAGAGAGAAAALPAEEVRALGPLRARAPACQPLRPLLSQHSHARAHAKTLTLPTRRTCTAREGERPPAGLGRGGAAQSWPQPAAFHFSARRLLCYK